MARFIEDYLELLDLRTAAIADQLQRSDLDGAVVTLLSLETSSTMAGADELAVAAAALRLAVQQQELDLERLLDAVVLRAESAKESLGSVD